MVKSNYLLINGKFVDENHSAELLKNRGFLFGDGFFESMHWLGSGSSSSSKKGRILFVEDHLERINNAFQILKLDQSDFHFNQLLIEAEQLILKNNITGDARIRMTFYRISEGNYTPANNNNGYMFSASPLAINGFSLNETGLTIGLYHEQTKSRSSISNIKTLNSLVYVLAGIFAREQQWDDVLIFNDAGNIIEAHTSNLFIAKDNILITPPLSDGCVDGVMRKQIIKLAKENGINVIEQSLNVKDIEKADELFISNAVNGIRWVEHCANNKFKKVFAEHLFSFLKKEVS